MGPTIRPRGTAAARLHSEHRPPTGRRLTGALVTALVALAALAIPCAAYAATSGGHLWSDIVFNVGGSGDESAVAVTTDAGRYPIIVGDGITSGAGDFDIRYRSYDLTGMLRWNSTVTTWPDPTVPGLSDTAAGVAVDDARNAVYVAGTTQGVTTGNDVVLLRVLDVGSGGSFSGELVWSRVYSAPAGLDDEAEAVALDKYGNIYVTGGTQRADGSMDVLTVKFRPDGTRAWVRRHNNAGARLDRGLAIAARGNAVYVAGVSNRKGHRDDLVLIRYSLGGKRKWVRYYDDPRHRHEMLSGVAAASGVVYVCGSGKSRNMGGGDALLVKYRADGKRLWARYARGSGGGFDAWNDVAVDSKGRAHVTGFLNRRSTGEDVVTRAYRANGRLFWQARFWGSGSGLDVGTALALDGSNRTFVCGMITRSGGETDGVVLSYTAKGVNRWSSTYPDSYYPWETDAGDDWFEDIAVNGPYVYAVGRQAVDHSGVVDADLLTLAIQR
jgi:hypothetical protein